MELLDRYLYEIRRYLPVDQQDDITAEISDAIQSQFEERERELGRPLTEAEESTIVKAFGHPKIVASRYQPPQYLIGPEIFPFYWYTLKIALVGTLGLELLGALIAALLNPTPLPAFLKNIAVAWPTIFLVLGVVTFIFVAIERTGSGATVLSKLGVDKWNPRALPRPALSEVSRFSLLVEAFVNILFMLWLLDFAPLRSLVGYVINAAGGGKALAPLALTPSWHPLLVLAFAAAALIVLQDFVLLVNPVQPKVRATTQLIANAFMVIGSCLALHSGSFVIAVQPAARPYVLAARALNEVSSVALMVLAVSFTIAAALNIRTLLQGPPKTDLNISYEARRE